MVTQKVSLTEFKLSLDSRIFVEESVPGILVFASDLLYRTFFVLVELQIVRCRLDLNVTDHARHAICNLELRQWQLIILLVVSE